MTTADIKRFEKYLLLPAKDDECWVWQGATCEHRYRNNRNLRGRFRFRGKVDKAHRVAHMLYIGEIPAGKNVLHSCDNSLCVNPAHLSAGTQRKNVQDMYARGRR